MKITVGKKIGAGFLLAAAAIAIIGVASYRSTLKLVETAGWVAQTEDVLKNLEATISAAKDLETGRRGYVITGDEAFLEPYDAALTRLDGLMGTLRLLIEDSGEQRRLSAIEPLIEESKRISKEIIDARKTVGFEAGQKLVMSGIGKRNMDEIRKRIAETKDGENVLMQTRKADADTAVARTQNMIILGGSAAVILLAFVGWLITKDIATPLGEVTAAADRIAGGDINAELAEVSRTDEVGALVQTFRRMCRSLNVLAGRARQIASGDLTARVQPQSQNDVLGNAFASMTDNLRKVIGEVIEAANVLRSSAAEISAATTQIAASASETATAVTQTTATVVEVKQASSSSSQIAEHVSSQAQKVADVSRQGRASVEDVITGMTRIREHMDSIGSSILRLNAQGQTIGEIISTVDELAGQSKMLAINASMEAAKAGEEGKGFAVVAQEVKNLAEQSRLATDRVRTILHEIEKATSTAVLTTEQGSKAVDAGLRQSSAAGDSITALSDSVTESAHSSSQIAVSSHQQSVGMDQVSLAMDNIQNASAKTAAGARQAESEAQRLVVLGRKLGELVAAFKV